MIGHRLVATTLLYMGNVAQGRAHFDQALALYDPHTHRPLATRFGQDVREATLCFRSWALWLLGYPEAALRDTDHALKDAREIAQAATLMFALYVTGFTHIFCGNYEVAMAQCDELVELADHKSAVLAKSIGMMQRGMLFTLTGKASEAMQMMTSGNTGFRSTESTLWRPLYVSHMARAYAELGQIDDAWRGLGEAMSRIETTNERWFEAEANRIAGEVALISPEQDAAKAQSYFDRALTVARQQQAKSWELRAAMSMARLWRGQGKSQQARELLAPVYGWFTEGFDTLDLKEAKALLEELAS